MKNIFFLLAVLASISGCQQKPIEEHRELVVTDSVWHYGTLEMDSGLASHRFWIVNRGGRNLVTLKVVPSCSCMTADYCRDVALEGDSLWVDVHFDTNGFKGDFSKTVQVKTTLGNVRFCLDGDVE